MSEETHLGPLALREFSLPRTCRPNVGHVHNYDHDTFVQAGGLRAFHRAPGEEAWTEQPVVFEAGEIIYVPAGREHKFECALPKPGTGKAAAVGVVRDLMRQLGVEPWELADETRYACAFTHRDAAGRTIQVYAGHDEAYV